MRIFAFVSFLFAFIAMPIVAQDTDSKSYLEGLLEDVLSSPQMQVRVRGLQGTFSSKAQVAELEFSDPTGVWMQIEDAVIDWNRAALLRKRVEVEALTAQKITLIRLPVGEETAVQPEATQFRVPQLPVAIKVEKIAVDQFIMEPAVIGQSAELALKGSINLVDGSMDVDFNADHLDGSGGLVIDTQYDPATGVLDVDLSAEEDADGLIVNLLGIPKRPSAQLTVKGSGPQTEFRADLALATDGADRLTGTVIASPLTPEGSPVSGARIVADIEGDISPLFDGPYQRFFGEASTLHAVVERRSNGALRISDMNLETAAFQVGGLLVLSPDKTPLRIDITSDIRDATGAPILLPLSGPETRLSSAQLAIDYTEGDPWTGTVDVVGFDRDGVQADLVQLTGGGAIAPAFLTKSSDDLLVSADLDLAVSGLRNANVDLNRAIGSNLTASGKLEVIKDQPFKLTQIVASNGNVEASLDGDISGLADALESTGIVTASVANLAPLSGIIGQNIRGRADFTAQGTIAILSGAFDLDFDASGAGLALGNPQVDPLLAGRNTISMSARRTVDGLFLEGLEVSNPQISASIDGTAQAGQILADVAARLNDAGVLSDTLTGPMQLDGTVAQNGTSLTVDVSSSGIGGLAAEVSGTIPMGAGAWDLAIDGSAPLALLDRATKSDAAKARGAASFDLRLQGQPTLQSLSGQVSTQNATVILPSQRLTINDIQSTTNFRGGVATINANAGISSGGGLTVAGTIGLDQTRGYPADIQVQLRDFLQRDRTFYSTVLNGDLTVQGGLLNGAEIGGTIRMSDTEVNLAGTTQRRLSFVPEIEHRFEPAGVRLTRARAGLLNDVASDSQGGTSRPFRLNLLIEAPTRVFIRGRGVDAEFGGSIRVAGTTQQVVPTGSFNLIRGRMDILGKRLSLTEGSLTMAGSLDPSIRVVATTTSGEYDTSIIVFGLVSDPRISLESSPTLPEDEILAQMFFGRSLDQISAFQALQIAAALRELSGQGGLKIVSQLRDKLDLDDFNIEVDEDGTAGVRAGKYISDNVYTDVTIAGDDKSEISINLDLNQNVTVRGAVSESGNSSVGVFFEKDY